MFDSVVLFCGCHNLTRRALAFINAIPQRIGNSQFLTVSFRNQTIPPARLMAMSRHNCTRNVVVFNVSQRDNGQPRAIQPHSLFASQQFATAVYQSELTYRVRQLGYEIATGRSGAPEIKGYTQDYLDASSPRSQQIREYLERTGRSGKEAAEIAAHSTRDRKEIHSPAEVMAAHRKLAADFGNQADAVVRAARERSQHHEKPVNSLDRVRESVTFSRDKNFEREAVVDERALIRDGLRRGMGEITHGQIRSNIEARLASGEFQIVQRNQGVPGRQYTTAKTIEAEQEIVSTMREGQNHAKPVLSRPYAIAVADQHSHLNHAQKSVIEDVLSSPDRIQGIQGFAGSGKTTLLRIIAGLETEYEGAVFLDGKKLMGTGLDRGVVFQEHRLLSWLTVHDNVGFGLGDLPPEERSRDIRHYMCLVGLDKFEYEFPGHQKVLLQLFHGTTHLICSGS
jgi:hypothetical protein